MRPPEFTGGNRAAAVGQADRHHHASMRPPEFTGGNLAAGDKVRRLRWALQ